MVLIKWADIITPEELRDCFYDVSSDPRRSDIPPQGRTMTWSRDPIGSLYNGNTGYPDWDRWPATNDYGRAAGPGPGGSGGTVAGPINDGRWHRITTMLTKEHDDELCSWIPG